MINGSSLNSHAINSPDFISETGSGTLIALSQSVGQVASGTLVSVEQINGFIASGPMFFLNQIVELRQVGSGSLVDIEQIIANTVSGNLILIEQRIIPEEEVSRIQRLGWDASISVAGVLIPNNRIVGNIIVDRTESQASLADFSILPEPGTYDYNSYIGKTVTIDVHTTNGTQRIYTGIVDIPELDIVNKIVSFKCTDRRTELINSQLPAVVNSIGYFSSLIFEGVTDTADILENRLSTTPQSVDFDAFSNYTLTSWFAKATPDFTFTDSDVYRNKSPKVRIASRARITNKVNINFQYRFERLHHMERNFYWESPIRNNVFLLLEQAYSMTFRSDIVQAVKSSGWALKGNVQFLPIWPSGWYGQYAWSTTSFQGTARPKLDIDGNPVLDASGKQVYEFDRLGGTDLAPLYCMGAAWTASTRWAQTITENYNITVSAPQSITQYGTIEQDETFSAQQDFDTAIWENYESHTNLGLGNNYQISQDTNRADFNIALTAAIAKARTSILATHRDTNVTFSSFIKPEIDLQHTAKIDTNIIEAKGKVYGIRHNLNISTGEAYTETTIALFKSQGSQSDSGIPLPARPTDSVTYPSSVIVLGNHYGVDPALPGSETWNGYIGNSRPVGQFYRTSYPESFIVDTPPITDSHRQEKQLNSSLGVFVEIPNDLLNISM